MLHVPDFDATAATLYGRTVARCRACHATGWRHEITSEDDFETTQVPCSCRLELRFQVGLRAGAIPPEYWGVEQFDFQYNKSNLEQVVRYCGDIRRARTDGIGFTMLGENGTGKTAMSIYILAKALRAGYTAAYLTAHSYLTSIPASWYDSGLRTWLDELVRADFLVLDEMGKEHKAKEEAKMAELDSLLRARAAAFKPTTVITNMSVAEFRNAYGASVDSILSARNKRLVYEPGDFRKRRGA